MLGTLPLLPILPTLATTAATRWPQYKGTHQGVGGLRAPRGRSLGGSQGHRSVLGSTGHLQLLKKVRCSETTGRGWDIQGARGGHYCGVFLQGVNRFWRVRRLSRLGTLSPLPPPYPHTTTYTNSFFF